MTGLVPKPAILIRLACLVSVMAGPDLAGQTRNPTVGAPGRIDQLVLQGTELQARAIAEHSPMIVRIANVFPHGDHFRYDIVFHGLEPGKYNLVDWLERKDGSTTADLPSIDVEIQSLLPPGQIEPNKLESGWLPSMGGYRNVMVAVILLWTLVLLMLVLGGRKSEESEPLADKTLTLADLLEPRLRAALDDRLEKEQFAELERMLFAFWRKRLDLENVAAASAMQSIRQHEVAGPLMKQLEQWMHNPGNGSRIDLSSLLAPYRDLPADQTGKVS